jgi:agmatinase
MTKEEKINSFNPNDIGDANNNIFGLPFSTEEAEVVVLSVPWEVTVSYGSGTVNGPEAIAEASYQVDLYDPAVPNAWKIGIAMDDIPEILKDRSNELRKRSEEYISLLEKGETWKTNDEMRVIREEVNKACRQMNDWVKSRSLEIMNQGKIVALIGGDHSTPLGLMQAVAEKHGDFAILQIDAHADLRDAYEGFEFSHASIMFNALKIDKVKKLVQAGIRDYCEAEVHVINDSKGRVEAYFDRDIKIRQYEGASWAIICQEIIGKLPDKVYISFDIDGLDPKLCPNTGTPVAGGFEFEHLIQKVVDSGKTIVAFDINEVSPGEDEWDANVGARLLYRMANLAAKSQGKAPVM